MVRRTRYEDRVAEFMRRAGLAPVPWQTRREFDVQVRQLRQMRRHSLLEAIANTAVGFILSNVAWPAVQVLILHQRYNPYQGLGAITVFTVLSVARNYATRRFFNKRAPPHEQ